jgi:hypothetical protein
MGQRRHGFTPAGTPSSRHGDSTCLPQFVHIAIRTLDGAHHPLERRAVAIVSSVAQPSGIGWCTARSTAARRPSHLRWPSLACLTADGDLLWSHFHGTAIEVGVGADDSVATVCPPQRPGRREWDYLNALVGV